MRWFLTGLIVAWAVAFFGSFAAFYLTPAKDFGLTAGLNKVSIFFGWQFAAILLALLCLGVRPRVPEPVWLRRMALAPAFALLLMVVAIAGLFAWATIQRNTVVVTAPPQKPVTAPAASVESPDAPQGLAVD